MLDIAVVDRIVALRGEQKRIEAELERLISGAERPKRTYTKRSEESPATSPEPPRLAVDE